MSPPLAAPANTLSRLRALLGGVYVLGAVGTGVELVLLEHVEDAWQWAPIALLAASLVALGWHAARRGAPGGARRVRAFQAIMVLSIVSGLIGTILHYRGNVEFALEMQSSLGGLALFWEAMRGATPALAPGTMIQLGLVGLAYTFRHPALGTPAERPSRTEDL